MTFTIQLLGSPIITDTAGRSHGFRSRKSWALLAYLIAAEHPPSREQLASLLFGAADDPLRALRWCISEIRRALSDGGSIEGDPVVLRLPEHASVDVSVVTKGTWSEAVALPGLGQQLLEGAAFREAAVFESWLLSERRHLDGATEAILHEAALGMMSESNPERAIAYAVRLVGLDALDENNQALLIRLYRLAGDDRAAQRQFAACTELFETELGVRPGPAVLTAMRAVPMPVEGPADATTVAATVEAGLAAVRAGAIDAGVQTLRNAVELADAHPADRLRVTSRLALAEALIHSMRGEDEAGVAALHVASQVAAAIGEVGLAADARAEIGYVDFLRARYDRAELWLNDARALGGDAISMATAAKTGMYLGAIASDRANYAEAVSHLQDSIGAARAGGELRMEAFAVSMLGRVHLIRGELDEAAGCLDESLELCERSHWLAFVPWPQALRGEVELGRSNPVEASQTFEQAFARACQLGDPCWEGISARGLALSAEAAGDSERAFEILADARIRSNRLADPYVWLEAHILDAQCALGLRHGHPETPAWASTMGALASRTGMRELMVRSLLHAESLGDASAGETARLIGAEIDNPVLVTLLAGRATQ